MMQQITQVAMMPLFVYCGCMAMMICGMMMAPLQWAYDKHEQGDCRCCQSFERRHCVFALMIQSATKLHNIF
jgi:hypothetical protein